MIEHFIGWMAGLIVAFISALGYWGVLILMAIESACIPLPSEVIMPFAGYLVATGQLNLWLVATAGAIGCNLGSIIAYEAGKHGGRPIVERWGKYILIDAHDLDRADAFFLKHGSLAVLIGRLLPVIRTFIAFPAGVARMPLGKFHFYTFVGSWPWCFALAWVGMKLGTAWDTDPRVQTAFHDAHLIIAGAIFVAGVWFVWHKLRKR
ncbi:MAG: DedA family protein [Sphingomonadales bacterium]|nr:DedA family protein [Sphingomonadales bacterium]